jgi:hypothetical protein
MKSNPSTSPVKDLRTQLQMAEEEKKRIEKLLRIEELREQLRASEEQQKNLQLQIQQAEQENTNGPNLVAKPEPVGPTLGAKPEPEEIHVTFQGDEKQDVGGPDCETPRAQPKANETAMASVQKPTKSPSFSPMSAFTKSRSKTYAEDKMVLNLDLDHPMLDEKGTQEIREAFASVEDLLFTAAQRVVGLDAEVMVELEVIGACAIAPVSASDTIDVLCKVSDISTTALFTILKQMLDADPAARSARDHPEVLTGSRLSGLRFSYANFQFRMFLAKVPWEESDEETFLSLNGCLVSRTLSEIASLNTSFPQALRMVKFWAQRRGIYGNACGYPGGITWSICLGRICQMYPKANAAELAVRFFKVYSSWNWQSAVALQPLDGSEPLEHDIVPEGTIAVMTPGGSPMNTAAHVKKATLPVLQEELQRAYKICKKIAKNQACWSDLYALPSISKKRKHYLRLEFVAETQEALNLLVEWAEVCLPVLLTKFEMDLPHVQITSWSHCVHFQHETYAFACSMFIGLRFAHRNGDEKQDTIDLRIPIVSFLEMMDKWPHKEAFAGQYDTGLQHLRRHELQQWCDKYAVEQKQLSDSQSDENMDSKEPPEQTRLSLQRWSDGLDEFTGMCVECR